MDGSGLLPVEWLHRIDAACERLEGFLDEQRSGEFEADVAQAVVASLDEGSPRILDETIGAWHRQASVEGFVDEPAPGDDALTSAAMEVLPEITGRAMLPYLRPEA